MFVEVRHTSYTNIVKPTQIIEVLIIKGIGQFFHLTIPFALSLALSSFKMAKYIEVPPLPPVQRKYCYTSMYLKRTVSRHHELPFHEKKRSTKQVVKASKQKATRIRPKSIEPVSKKKGTLRWTPCLEEKGRSGEGVKS